jgi:hypothetical protein
VSSPYRTPHPPSRRESDLDVSPAVLVVVVAAFVAVVLMSHERPERAADGWGIESPAAELDACPRGHSRGRGRR